MASSSALSRIISNAPAVVEWIDADGQTRYLYGDSTQSSPEVAFNIYLDAASGFAFFSLKVSIRTTSLRGNRQLYLFIHPERVTSLVHHGPSQMPEGVREKLGTSSVVGLSFVLSKPADLIMPFESSSLMPGGLGDHKSFLDALQLVARQTSISIYSDCPTSVPVTVFQFLGAAISNGDLKTDSSTADLTSMYGGKGGKVFGGAESYPPPSYDPAPSSPSDDLGGLPPPAPLKRAPAKSDSFKKRRRDSSLETARHDSDVEDVCRKMMEEFVSQSREEMRRLVELSMLRAEKISMSMDELRGEVEMSKSREEEMLKSMEEMRKEVEMSKSREEEMLKSMEEMRREVEMSKSREERLSRSLEKMRSHMQNLRSKMGKMRQMSRNEETEADEKPAEFTDVWLRDQVRSEVEAQVGRLETRETEVETAPETGGEETRGSDAERTMMTMQEVKDEIRIEVKVHLGELAMRADMKRELERSTAEIKAEIKAEITEHVQSALDQFDRDLEDNCRTHVDEMLACYYDQNDVDELLEKAMMDVKGEIEDGFDDYVSGEVDQLVSSKTNPIRDEVEELRGEFYCRSDMDQMLCEYYNLTEADQEILRTKDEIMDEVQGLIEQTEEALEDKLECRLDSHSLAMEQEVESLKEEVESLEEEVESLKDEVESLKGEVESRKDEVESLEEEVESLKNEVESLENEVRFLENEVESMENEVRFLENEVEDRMMA